MTAPPPPLTLTTLPDGGRADHAWSLLSENMRTLFRVTINAGARDRLVMGTSRTLGALARRGLVDPGDLHRLTPTGRALLRWAANPTGITPGRKGVIGG